MKCPRCGLENLDHVKTCVKCRWRLGMVSLPADFSPETPRASRLQPLRKLYWKWCRSRRVFLSDDRSASGRRFLNPGWLKSVSVGELSGGSLLAMIMSFILPGSGQFLLARPRRGYAFILSAAIVLVLIVQFVCSYNVALIELLFNIYLIIQTIAVFDAMPKSRPSARNGWMVNLFLAVIVWFGCFSAVNSAMPRITDYFWQGAGLLTLNNFFPRGHVLQRGDTVVVRRQENYPRGSIVIYTCSLPYLYGNRCHWMHVQAVDRIIAIPGETVSVQNSVVSVNSTALPDQKLLTLLPHRIPDMQWTLGPDEYFVVTSDMPARLIGYLSKRRESTVLKSGNIRGRLTRIVSPTSRIRTL